ncbi:MAG: histidine kinase dimerization/phospho-acceptor domain-containing protein, partial [bacterium]
PVMVSTVATDLYGKKVYITSTRDISVQKELEAQRLETERLNSVRQTAGGLAHELSQPLQALISLTDILERIPPDQWDTNTLVERLKVNVNRIIDLLKRMRSITSVESRMYISGEEIIDLGGSDKL